MRLALHTVVLSSAAAYRPFNAVASPRPSRARGGSCHPAAVASAARHLEGPRRAAEQVRVNRYSSFIVASLPTLLCLLSARMLTILHLMCGTYN